MIYRKGELFCGPGGLALGAKTPRVFDANNKEYRIQHVWANDIDEWACETFRNNICPDQRDSVYCMPVQELDFNALPDIDALTFGFPCNDFSVVGKQKGIHGDYGPLYQYGVKALNIKNPQWFLAENVGGLSSANDGKVFAKILSELASAGKYGYNLTTHLYKFEEYGVPQTRHRILIVGIRNDLNLTFKVPKPNYNYRTSRQALEEPPIPTDAKNHEFTNHKPHVVKMLDYIPPGGNAWSETIPEELRLNVKGAKLSQIYKRLHPDYPAYTVTGSGGGGTHVYHWKESRALTNRERARLQTFPDTFVFEGGKESVRRQIGMAVPPKAAEIVFEAILKTLAGIEYEYVEAKWSDTTQDIAN